MSFGNYNYFAPMAINDLGTAFVAVPNPSPGVYDIYAFPKTGGSIYIGQTLEYVLLNNVSGEGFYASDNTASGTHPEGVLYYRSGPFTISGTDGSTLLDTAAQGAYTYIGQFYMNQGGQYVYTDAGNFALYNNNGRLLGVGDQINGETVNNIITASINSSGNIAAYVYFTDGNKAVYEFGAKKSCRVSDKGRSVPFWSQADPAWSTQLLDGKSGETIGDFGCALSDTAMVFESYGIKFTPLGQAINPGSLNSAMESWDTSAASLFQSYAYTNTGGIIWPGTTDVGRYGYVYQCVQGGGTASQCQSQASNVVSFGKAIDYYNAGVQNTIDNQICAGNPVILKLNKVGSSGFHYVLATGTTLDSNGNESYIVNNPGDTNGGNEILSDLVKRYPSIAGIRYFVPANDPSSIFSYGSANIDYVITDPSGRRTGYDPTSGTTYSEIPGAGYSADSITTPVANDPSSTPIQKVFSNTQSAVDGQYTINIFGDSAGTYDFNIYGFDNNGYFNSRTDYSGQINAGQELTFTYNHSSDTLPQPNAKLELDEGSYRNFKTARGGKTDVSLAGRLVPNGANHIQLSSSFQITFGGLSGITETFAASSFKTKHGRYIYFSDMHRGEPDFIIIDERGNFQIQLHDLDLSGVPNNTRGLIFVKVDNTFGEALEKYACENRHRFDWFKFFKWRDRDDKVQNCHLIH